MTTRTIWVEENHPHECYRQYSHHLVLYALLVSLLSFPSFMPCKLRVSMFQPRPLTIFQTLHEAISKGLTYNELFLPITSSFPEPEEPLPRNTVLTNALTLTTDALSPTSSFCPISPRPLIPLLTLNLAANAECCSDVPIMEPPSLSACNAILDKLRGYPYQDLEPLRQTH